VIELNRAVAISKRDGPTAGLTLVDDLLARGELDDYHWLYSARADLCRRIGKIEERERRIARRWPRPSRNRSGEFLQRRLSELHYF